LFGGLALYTNYIPILDTYGRVKIIFLFQVSDVIPDIQLPDIKASYVIKWYTGHVIWKWFSSDFWMLKIWYRSHSSYGKFGEHIFYDNIFSAWFFYAKFCYVKKRFYVIYAIIIDAHLIDTFCNFCQIFENNTGKNSSKPEIIFG